MNESESYIYGLLITDGSLYLSTRNRGRVTLEVNEKDKDIVEKLYNEIPNSKIKERTRNTNFKNEYSTKIFSNSRLEFREKLISQGFPVKDKTLVASIPSINFNKYHFWRGVIDGDGSLGITSNNIPFISLVTKSENLKNEYLNFLFTELGVIKNINRNKRDDVYNIYLSGNNAIKLIKILYIDNPGIYLDRKYNKALEIQNRFY